MIVEKHPSNSEQGIYDSHIVCLKAGLAAGANTIVVFEDDVLLSEFSHDVLGQSVAFMQSDVTWDAFFFGGWVNASRRTPTPSVVQVNYRCSAHAYVLHRRFAQKVVQQPWDGQAFDDVLRAMSANHAYAAYPLFAFQSDSPTDNDKRIWIDRMRRAIGGSRVLQRRNEFSTLYFRELVIIHVLIVLGMVLFAVLAHRGHWFRHEPLDFLFRPRG